MHTIDEEFWKPVVFKCERTNERASERARTRSQINPQNGNHLFRFVSIEFDLVELFVYMQDFALKSIAANIFGNGMRQ